MAAKLVDEAIGLEISELEMGFNWSNCAGSDLWTYDGVKLNAMTPTQESASSPE